jgi:hypothetical protein
MTTTDDIEGVRRLLAEYCLAADECRYDDWARLFGDDGVMVAFRRDWSGFEALTGFISNAPQGLHLNTSVRIDIDGDQATALSNFVFFNLDRELSSMGLYADTLIREGDGWRFARREIRMAKPVQPQSD